MDKHETNILDAIRHGFSSREGRRIPKQLRSLALTALREGHTPGAIAQAAGVSRQTVVNWKRASVAELTDPVPTPVELKVIDAPDQAGRAGETAAARITLCSGVTVELPAVLLDVRWLVALNRSAP